MRRRVNVIHGRIENGNFVADEATSRTVSYFKAKALADNARELLSERVSSIGGKRHMKKDHMVKYAELYGARGGLKEIHIVDEGLDVSEEDFIKFIQPYGYICAYHK